MKEELTLNCQFLIVRVLLFRYCQIVSVYFSLVHFFILYVQRILFEFKLFCFFELLDSLLRTVFSFFHISSPGKSLVLSREPFILTSCLKVILWFL